MFLISNILLITKNFEYYLKYLPIIILVFLLAKFILPNSKKRFFKFQSVLPTSKISSMAMGMVELEGQIEMLEPLHAPASKEECIGYYYTIEEITKDSSGKKKYKVIHRETKCNNFNLIDETGKVNVKGEGIEFFMLETTNIISNNIKRHKETLIVSGQKMSLIGYADKENDNTIIKKDNYNKILGITSSVGLSLWNKYEYLWKSFLLITYAISIFIAIIILS